MACFSETASDALEHHHREREEKALNLIDYLADLSNNESLHDIKGNEDILRRKRLALHSGNSTTHAEIAAYDADYEESRICAIIRHITPKTFSEHHHATTVTFKRGTRPVDMVGTPQGRRPKTHPKRNQVCRILYLQP